MNATDAVLEWAHICTVNAKYIGQQGT